MCKRCEKKGVDTLNRHFGEEPMYAPFSKFVGVEDLEKYEPNEAFPLTSWQAWQEHLRQRTNREVDNILAGDSMFAYSDYKYTLTTVPWDGGADSEYPIDAFLEADSGDIMEGANFALDFADYILPSGDDLFTFIVKCPQVLLLEVPSVAINDTACVDGGGTMTPLDIVIAGLYHHFASLIHKYALEYVAQLRANSQEWVYIPSYLRAV